MTPRGTWPLIQRKVDRAAETGECHPQNGMWVPEATEEDEAEMFRTRSTI